MATTSPFNLRKLIHTHLYQDDAVAEDDDTSSSCYEDDLPSSPRNHSRKRSSITTWLAPRKGSTSNSAHSRSTSDSASPLHTHQHHYQHQVPEVSLPLFGAGAHSSSTSMLDSQPKALNDVPSLSILHDPFQDPTATLPLPRFPDFCNTQGHRRARSHSVLESPISSSPFDYLSPSAGYLDDSPVAADDPAIMEASPKSLSDSTLNRDSLSTDWSEGVRQLIEETDLAFGGVGSGFIGGASNSLDLPRMSQDMSRSNPDLTSLKPSPLLVAKPHEKNMDKANVGPKAEAPLDIPPRRSSRVKDDVLRSERRKSRSVPPPINVRRASSSQGTPEQRKTSPLATQLPTSPSPTSPAVNSHNKTPPLKSTNNFYRRHKQTPSSSRRPHRSTRWALPDNVTDILTGNVFKRNQVDELLTSEQLAKFKQEREEAKRKKSQPKPPRASDESDLSRSSSEQEALGRGSQSSEDRTSSHKSQPSLGSLSTQTSASSDDAASNSEENKPSASKDNDENRPPTPPKKSKERFKKQGGKQIKTRYDEGDDDDGLMTFDLLGEPSPLESTFDEPFPPPKNPLRYAPPTKDLPEPPNNENAKRDNSKLLAPEEDDEYFYLKSTPYSLTTPHFRHGRIAFAKSEFGKGALTMDETLDWTAFQMAILGAGEFLPDMDDEGDNRLAEDVADWFGDFGFDTHGHLVPEAWPSSPRSSSQSTISSTPSEHDLPLPAVDHTRDLAYGANWKDMDEKIVDEYDDKIPAFDEDEAPIGMGYNLQGDLGDFLQWEAQYALGSGYYGVH